MARRPSRKSQQRENILQHGFKLKRVFFSHDPYSGIGPVELAKKVHRLEVEAHRLAEDEASRPLPEGYVEKKEASIMRRLDALLHFKSQGIPVFLNSDPRGYALKIDDSYVREHDLEIYKDWGGYGILAPEF